MSDTRNKCPILLVDDEPEILSSLLGLLRREFELYTAESGAAALEILGQHAIHVIMTDQRMPNMTGVELMGRVKEQYPDAIRMVFTGYADIKAVIEAINEGGLYRYITKPWDPDELVDVLRQAAAKYDEAVEQKQLLRELYEHVQLAQHISQELGGHANLDASVSDQIARLRTDGDGLLARLENAIGKNP